MKTNKKFASLALVTLLAPTLLNAQLAFAEDTQSAPVEQQEVVPEEKQPETEKEVDVETQPEAEKEVPQEETKPESKPEPETPKEEAKPETTPEAEKEAEKTETPKKEKADTNVTVIVNIVDQDAGPIHTLSFTGEAGTTQNVSLELTTGAYTFVSTSNGMAIPVADAAGNLGLQLTFPDTNQIVSVTVKKLAGIVGGNVYVAHIDDRGLELTQAITILGGFIGESYTTEPRNIPGYILVNTPVNSVGEFTDTEQEVIYRYDRVKTTVSVVCVDENGVPLGDVVSEVGKFDDTFTITAPEVPGYEYLGISQAAYSASPSMTFEGTYGLEDQSFVATYRKIVEVPAVPAAPTAPTPGIQTTTAPTLLQETIKTELLKTEPTKKEHKKLPETGETETSSFVASLGLTIIAAVYFTKKKREDEFSL
ncbi:MucBP domain-containing protein [Enterococcus rotai]|uniref:MucBP domain-containing protein n=1 Tax=Enterococcus rotai TaxID=118060 RepID=UPI0035C6C123